MALPLGLKVMLLNYALTLALLPGLYVVVTELCETSAHVSYPVGHIIVTIIALLKATL